MESNPIPPRSSIVPITHDCIGVRENSVTRGFAVVGEPDVAVCLLAGTEIAFDENVRYDRAFGILPARKIDHRLARFRQIDMKTPGTHHDALEDQEPLA